MPRRALGAGPGPTRTYRIDMPLPWGADTPVTLPIRAMVDDIVGALTPYINQAAGAISANVQSQVQEGVSIPLQQGLASGAVIVKQVSWTTIAAIGILGLVAGYMIGRR